MNGTNTVWYGNVKNSGRHGRGSVSGKWKLFLVCSEGVVSEDYCTPMDDGRCSENSESVSKEYYICHTDKRNDVVLT